jgi:hypothetical protein
MTKCCGELMFIFIYVGVILTLVITLVYAITLGNILSCLVEFALALAFDQIKSILSQTVIYWVIVRRLGTLPISAEFQNNNSKWDDDLIF